MREVGKEKVQLVGVGKRGGGEAAEGRRKDREGGREGELRRKQKTDILDMTGKRLKYTHWYSFLYPSRNISKKKWLGK